MPTIKAPTPVIAMIKRTTPATTLPSKNLTIIPKIPPKKNAKIAETILLIPK